MDRLLQSSTPAPSASGPHADGSLARGSPGLKGCGHDGQRIRVAHMPTAATANAASCCLIERNPERPGRQFTNRLKRSHCTVHFYLNALPSTEIVRRMASRRGLEPLTPGLGTTRRYC